MVVFTQCSGLVALGNKPISRLWLFFWLECINQKASDAGSLPSDIEVIRYSMDKIRKRQNCVTW